MTDGPIPGPDPGACETCGRWRKAGVRHDCSESSTAPHDLHRRAGGDREEYLRLMVEHGHLVPLEQGDRCASCGISKQNVLAKHEEVRLKLVAMTEARDLCKRQTASIERRYLDLRAWLRDEHPEVYASLSAPGDKDELG